MKILISGGSGLLGTFLTEDFVASGHDVLVLSRSPRASSLSAVRHVLWDAQNVGMWIDEAATCEVWIHLAGDSVGEGRWTRAKRAAILASRVDSGRALCAAVETLGAAPRVFVQASGVGYYGAQPGTVEEPAPSTESAGPGGDFLAQVCLAWESSTEPIAERGARHVTLRTGVVLAREGGAFPRLVLPFRLFAGGPVGSGRQWVPWIHIADYVRAVRFLVDSPAAAAASGPVNLVAPEAVRQRELARAIGRELRRPAGLRVPAWAVRLALGAQASIVLEGQRVEPRRLAELGFSFRHPDLATALHDLLEDPMADAP
jgi:uncharacterized protein